jgi:hypothetical protein
MASGRLGVKELDERIQRVFAATTRPELERLVDDVLVPATDSQPLAAGSTALAPSSERLRVRLGSDGTGRILSIFSGTERKGRWRVAATCKVRWHRARPLRRCAADTIELKVVSWFSGAAVIVPPGLNVEVSDVAILAGNAVDVGEERPDPGGPTIRIQARVDSLRREGDAPEAAAPAPRYG